MPIFSVTIILSFVGEDIFTAAYTSVFSLCFSLSRSLCGCMTDNVCVQVYFHFVYSVCFCVPAYHCVPCYDTLCVSACTLKVSRDLACLFLSACLVRTVIVSCQRFSVELENVYDLVTKDTFPFLIRDAIQFIGEKCVIQSSQTMHLIGKRNFWKGYFIIECLNFAYPLRLTKLLKDSQRGFTVITKLETALNQV